METPKERAARLIKEMREEISNRGEPRGAICLRCKCRFIAYREAENLCSKQCREEYLDRPRKFAKGGKKVEEEPMRFSLSHRFGEEAEKVLCAYGILNWLLEQREENEADQRFVWKNEVLTLSVGQGMDSGNHCIAGIS